LARTYQFMDRVACDCILNNSAWAWGHLYFTDGILQLFLVLFSLTHVFIRVSWKLTLACIFYRYLYRDTYLKRLGDQVHVRL